MIEDNTKFYSKVFALAVALVIGLSWTNALDYLAISYVDDALVDAGVAFAIGRGINAAGSVLESLSFSFSFGVGGELSPGEAISPLLDMVEDFSTVMKFAIGSLVLQKLLVEIVGTTLFNILLTISGGVAVASFLLNAAKYQLIAMKTFVTLVVIRFLVVLMAVLSGIASQLFLDERLEQDLNALRQAEASVESISSEPVISDGVRQKLEAEVSVIQSEKDSLASNSNDLKQQLASKKDEIVLLEQEMEQYSVTDTYNPFTSNEDAKETKSELTEAESELSRMEDKLEIVEDNIEEANEQLDILNKRLRGESTGFMGGVSDSISNIGGKISGMADKMSYENLKNSMSDAIDSMLRAMVAFILRSILLPLAFLYLVSKFFKVVWGIDFSEKLKETRGKSNNNLKAQESEL
ncbi:hypothetical protein CEW91_12030 [Idiomarina piscisalsi]|uniref:Uncharacterized protein n=1 Tax=Idiomarina piscisalsi TaxID=1096243 RepID=A0ABM6LVZ5_9GAMM|nr:hypothetical protein [Idiomarina piscisalsi]ASG66820.1 hypothetical protein CEW91_12030 [Idiomarina piscisalsi]